MPNYNSITIVGHAGKDPEIRMTQKGDPVASFSVATKDYQDKTTWFDVSVFGKTAESYVGKYLKKGAAVMVVGPVSINEYESKGGEKRFSLRVTARDVQILSRSDEAEKPAEKQAPKFEDEIPFN